MCLGVFGFFGSADPCITLIKITQTQFAADSNGNFGSGWTWYGIGLIYNSRVPSCPQRNQTLPTINHTKPIYRLVQDNGGKLKIVKTSNADLPITEGLNPLLVIDVREHAASRFSDVLASSVALIV